MKIIFCSDPLNSDVIDPDFVNEADISSELGFSNLRFSFEELTVFDNVNAAFKSIPRNEIPIPAFYRGWMMNPPVYDLFYTSLLDRGYQLLNSAKQYKYCHWLPESYAKFKDVTPKSIWFPNGSDFSAANFVKELAVFRGAPVVLKDYVKSQKHYWNEACFIKDSSNTRAIGKVVSKFLELQDNEPQGGLVFREFIELEPIGTHSISGMPLTLEYRIFYLHSIPISVFKYWDDGEYGADKPDMELFNNIAQSIESNIFTMDVARTKSGDWIIVELGDGQVAGFPENADIEKFYSNIKRILS
jgi:hypothetical protein